MKKALALFAVLLGSIPALWGQSPRGNPITVGVRQVASGLTAPVALVEPPDGSRRLFIVDQIGLIRVLLPNGQLLPEPFLDLRDRMVALRTSFDERGLLGLAFHPRYAENGRFFVFYSAPLRAGAPAEWNCTSTISEFLVSASPNRGDAGSERIVLQVDKPQFNHNGGTVAFGPDGYLYISIGDGGGANDIGLGHVED
jgi:glucose/arabinose dehydrogenase